MEARGCLTRFSKNQRLHSRRSNVADTAALQADQSNDHQASMVQELTSLLDETAVIGGSVVALLRGSVETTGGAHPPTETKETSKASLNKIEHVICCVA